MIVDKLGNIRFNSKDIIKEIYKGNLFKLENASVEEDAEILQYINYIAENFLSNYPLPSTIGTIYIDKTTFDLDNQKIWYMPENYYDLNIKKYLFDRCENDKELARVREELILFEDYKMINLLKYLKFLVDTMKENSILWGVGRGSSVASYCLFLLGLHKVDSIKYNLDIKEFLK